METRQIAIYGGGGFGREVAWLARECRDGDCSYQVVCFIDDNPSGWGRELNGIPVMSLESARRTYPLASVVGAVGTPGTRQVLMEKARVAGFDFHTLIHPRTERSEWITIGIGTVICAGTVLTTNIVLGESSLKEFSGNVFGAEEATLRSCSGDSGFSDPFTTDSMRGRPYSNDVG